MINNDNIDVNKESIETPIEEAPSYDGNIQEYKNKEVMLENRDGDERESPSNEANSHPLIQWVKDNRTIVGIILPKPSLFLS
jgi:hypothetical protein